jgi:hypothetical protein
VLTAGLDEEGDGAEGEDADDEGATVPNGKRARHHSSGSGARHGVTEDGSPIRGAKEKGGQLVVHSHKKSPAELIVELRVLSFKLF